MIECLLHIAIEYTNYLPKIAHQPEAPLTVKLTVNKTDTRAFRRIQTEKADTPIERGRPMEQASMALSKTTCYTRDMPVLL